MRIRSVKPEFWRSSDTAQLTYFARLLFVGLWNYVDDSGVGEYDECLIRSDLFPRDPVEEISVMIQGGITELYRMGQITLYEHVKTGRRYLAVVNWHHQYINRPTKSNRPRPTSADVRAIEPSLSTHVPLTEDSPMELGNKGTRELGNKGSGESEGVLVVLNETSAPAKAVADDDQASKRGTRISKDWEPSDSLKAALVEKYPHVKLGDILEEFRDYWVGVPGQRGRKLDWDATFRNRVREVADNPRFQRHNAQTSIDRKMLGYGQAAQRLAEMADQEDD